MGSIPWKGRALHAGLKATIAGKEVELDVAVSASQLPSMDADKTVTSDIPSTSSALLDTPQPSTSKHFVAPASFYAASKPKTKGPR